MKRRKFIKNIVSGSAGAITLGGTPIRLLAGNEALKYAAAASDNDNVLIFVQLHGGNDALNTLIPVHQYDEYYTYRANIAIPKQGLRKYIDVDQSLPSDSQIGLHPDMIFFKQLYDQGKAVIVQNVGYPGMNMSHFHGRDLVFMGLDGNDDELGVRSGWMGRFLDYEYPGYPDDYPTEDMPDPIAIEIGSADRGSSMSIAFHRENGIPIGLSIQSPDHFYNLINGVGVDDSLYYRPQGHAGDELEYIWQFEGMSNVYAERLAEVYNAGNNSSVDYPSEYPHQAPSNYIYNYLSEQLRLIARLIDGGIKTKIFLCRLGGFDTHASQVVQQDSTYGTHAALLYHLSSSIKAFQDDLANLGLEEKVVTMTFTEFGRRVYSNQSYGTDHGTSTPVFIFGSSLHGKVVGTNPDLSNLNNGNMQYNIDYRQIYASIVQDWFNSSPEAVEAAGFSEWTNQRINLFSPASLNETYTSVPKVKCFPNPATNLVNFQFYLHKSSGINIQIINSLGQKVLEKEFGRLHFGQQTLNIDLSELDPGNYIYLIRGDTRIGTGKFIKY
ncbi:MAG: DUF1501 domain-containing protein [Bacteroidales bacterium]|jgi:uncharacterized protein (DUF1501 family)